MRDLLARFTGGICLMCFAALIFSGCAQTGGTATANATTANNVNTAKSTRGQENSAEINLPVAEKYEPTPRPMKRRKLVIDETGNAYQMLNEGEGMCDDCDL